MIEEIKTVCFAGAGTMGSYNSLITALAGYNVFLFDVSEDALEAVPQRQHRWGEVIVEQGRYSFEDINAAVKRIIRTSDPEVAAKDADLFSESVLEQLDLKHKVHHQFDQLLPDRAIMTTNTSTLLVSEIETAVARKENFAAMHFHQTSALVDIVAGTETSARTVDIIKRFIQSQGQEYVFLKKEREGYLHNAMFGAMLSSAMMLAALFKADIREIDRSWMINRNAPHGPFATMDFVGLNVVADSIKEKQNRVTRVKPEIYEAVEAYLRPFLENGNLGVKCNRGFYHYPDPAFEQTGFLDQGENKELSAPILVSFLSKALELLADGYGEMEDISKSWTLIHNSEDCPFATIDRIGLDDFKKMLLDREKGFESLFENTEIFRSETERSVALLDTFINRGALGVKTGKGFYNYSD